jgi:glucosamine 6-phosphate synthetase-like amidotransferase/phosphosugar isomerase protein
MPVALFFPRTTDNIEQVRARKGPVIAITSGKSAKHLAKIADDIVVVPKVPRLRAARS